MGVSAVEVNPASYISKQNGIEVSLKGVPSVFVPNTDNITLPIFNSVGNTQRLFSITTL